MKHSSQQSLTILLLGASALVLMGWGAHVMQQKAVARDVVLGEVGVEVARIAPASGVGPGFAGDFLASYHAQSQYDWKSANEFLERVLVQDPENPYLSPFEEMQRFKTHPAVKKYLEGGRRIAYGARALVEGGYQSLPKLTFRGGLLIGDTAGFLNVPKIKGNHMAMKSGMVAADSLAALLKGAGEYGAECVSYPENLKASWLWKELYKVRNIRPGFHCGMWFGFIHAAFQTLGGWMLPYTLKNHADHKQLKRADEVQPIVYPKPDNVLTFDRLTSVRLSNTMHEEGQPSHLKLRDPSIPVEVNLPLYAEPAQRYCPAAVYEIVEQEGDKKFVINSQNCVHCKTCDIKDPSQNIDWTVPQGGGGPNYTNM